MYPITLSLALEYTLLYVHRSEMAYWGGGGGGGGGRKSEDSTADTARKRPERLWTAARTMEVLKAVSPRHCPATNATAVSTAVLGQSDKDNVRCTAVEEQLEAKEVQLSQHSSTSLLMISSGLMKVQLHLPPLDLLISPGTLCSLSFNTSIYRFVSTHLP